MQYWTRIEHAQNVTYKAKNLMKPENKTFQIYYNHHTTNKPIHRQSTAVVVHKAITISLPLYLTASFDELAKTRNSHPSKQTAKHF